MIVVRLRAATRRREDRRPPAMIFAGLWVRARIIQRLYDEDDVGGYDDHHDDLVRAIVRTSARYRTKLCCKIAGVSS
jgi:hypothetical protein